MPHMFDKYFICDESFKNVVEDGEVTGFQIGVKVSYYRGVILGIVNDMKVTVDGQTYNKEDMTFTVKAGTFTFEQMAGRDDVRWDFGEVAYLRMKKPGGLTEGRHTVRVFEEIRIAVSYTHLDVYKRQIENRRDEIVIFLQVIWELIDQWANDYEAYKEAVHEFYNDNGKEFDEEQIDYEFSQNRLLSSEAISSSDYFMGDGMPVSYTHLAKMANTGPPTMGKALPSSQQGMAISRHSAVPGAIFLNIVIKTSLSLVLFRTILPILHQVKLLIFILA